MGLATAKYDITLDSIGYILQSESYRKKAQQPFNPRFSTGDPSLTDLSFWQFVKQEAWNGGAGQKDFSTINKFQKSSGWSFLSGNPRLSGGNAPIAGLSPVQLANVEAIGGTTCHVPAIAHCIPFGQTIDGRRNLCLIGHNATGFTCDGTRSILRAPAVGVTGIWEIEGQGAARWMRQSPSAPAGYLALGRISGATKYVSIYNSAWTSVLDQAIDNEARCIVPVNHNVLLAIGPNTNTSVTSLYVARITLNDNANTLSALTYAKATDVPFVPSPHWAKDSDGTIYVSLTSTLGLSTYEGFGSAIMLITTTEALTATAPVISEIVEYPDFFFTGVCRIANDVYAIGAKMIKSTTPTYKACVMKFPGTVIWESEYSSSTLLDILPRCMWADGRNEAYFINKNKDSGYFQSVMRLRTDSIVEEVYSLQEDSTADRLDAAAIGRIGSSLYIYDRSGNRIILATPDPATTRTSENTMVLTTSRYGGNTPLIDKTLYSISCELSAVIPAGETLTIKVNGTSVGTLVNADGLSKEIILDTEVTNEYFEVTFEMAHDSTWSGEIYKTQLRYLPTQFKKWAWAFGIRCDRNLKLIDGMSEAHTGKELIAHIAASRAKNVPIAFVDLDGTSYTVIVTDFDLRKPLVNDRGGDYEEAFIYLELLEV